MTPELIARILLWVDDLLLQSSRINDHLYSIRLLLELCFTDNIKLHPYKCTLFTKSVTWCGRLPSEDRIRYDPRNISGLEIIVTLSTGVSSFNFSQQ